MPGYKWLSGSSNVTARSSSLLCWPYMNTCQAIPTIAPTPPELAFGEKSPVCETKTMSGIIWRQWEPVPHSNSTKGGMVVLNDDKG